MNQNQWELENENDLGYGQLFAKLWNRRFLFLGVFSGVLAVAIPLSLIKQPIYQSYMQVLVKSNYEGKVLQGRGNSRYLESEFADASIEVDYATQLKVFKSSQILDKVINQLMPDASAVEKFEFLEVLRDSLNVVQLTEEDNGSKSDTATNIIQAAYSGTTPEQTKDILDSIQEVYLAYNLEQQEKRLRDGLEFIKGQIPKARNELLKVEAQVTELTQEHNLISPEEEAIALKENIRQIAQEREALKAEQSQTEGDYRSIQEQLNLSSENSIALSRLTQSPRYQNLLDKLQETEILLAETQAKFTQDNPSVQNLIEQRDSQKSLLIGEAERVLGELAPSLRQELESVQKQRQLVDSDTGFVDRITEAQSNLAGIRQKDGSLAQTKVELESQLKEFPVLIAQYRDLNQKAEIQRGALQRLLEARQELEIELNRGGFDWQVIEPPRLGEKVAPNLLKDLLLSGVVASFLGIAAVFIKDTMDEKIDNTYELERQASLPILGSAPGLPASTRIFDRVPFLSSNPVEVDLKDVIQWQPFRESLDLIYENLKMSCINLSLKSLAITSAVVGEGKSTFTLGLALSIARHQKRVLVIDADLRRPSLHKPFELNNDLGLSNYLAGEIDQPPIRQVSFLGETIDLITSGSVLSDPVKLLSSISLDNYVQQQKQNYDLILLDTPPALGMVDAIKLAVMADSALIVTRLGQVKVSELMEATSVLSKLNVLGIVANDHQEGTMQYRAKAQNLLPQQV